MAVVSLKKVKDLLTEVLQLEDQLDSFDGSSVLLGGIPELDSMAVVSVITAMEDEFDIMVEDDDISAEVFETLGALTEFINAKLP